jgi:hypothetical protein
MKPQNAMKSFLKEVQKKAQGLELTLSVDENIGYTTYIFRASHECGFKTVARMSKKTFHFYRSLTILDAIFVDFWEYANERQLHDLIRKLADKI